VSCATPTRPRRHVHPLPCIRAPPAGKAAVKALLSPAYGKLKAAPKVASEDEATALLTSLIPYAFFLRVERGGAVGKPSGPKALQVVPQQGAPVTPAHYFAWFYEGSQLSTYVGATAMVGVMLAGVMFPLWPPIMRLGVYYLSLAVLGLVGLFVVLAVVRLIFYVITIVAASPGIWIFPNLFADVGFVRVPSFVIRPLPWLTALAQVDSFIPTWEWDLPKKKGKKKRADKDGDGDGAPSEKKARKNAAAAAEAAPAPVGSARIEEVTDEEDVPALEAMPE
jgi:translocation protein SEC62